MIAPPAMFVYCYVWRGGMFDAWPGFFYALQRTTAEMILSLQLAGRVLTRGRGTAAGGPKVSQ